MKYHCRVGQIIAFSDDVSASLSEFVSLEQGAVSGSAVFRDPSKYIHKPVRNHACALNTMYLAGNESNKALPSIEVKGEPISKPEEFRERRATFDQARQLVSKVSFQVFSLKFTASGPTS